MSINTNKSILALGFTTLWIGVSEFLRNEFLFKLLQKFSFKETIILSWPPTFLMMWITIYNLQVLPLELLLFTVPLSLVEVYIASLIIKHFMSGEKII